MESIGFHRRTRAVTALVAALITLLPTDPLHAQVAATESLTRCEMDAGLKLDFASAFPSFRDNFPTAAERASRSVQRLALTKRYPNDVAVQSALINAQLEDGAVTTDEIRSQLAARAETRPRNSANLYLYALQLRERSPRDALTLMLEALALSPDSPAIHQALASAYSRPPLEDHENFTTHFKAFTEKCSDRLGIYAYFSGFKDSAFVAKGLSELRGKLLARPPRQAECSLYQMMWTTKFRITPVADHAAARADVDADLARLRNAGPIESIPCLNVLKTGYEITGNDAGKIWVRDSLVANFPSSSAAIEIALSTWQAENPPPKVESDATTKLEYARQQYVLSQSLLKTAPTNFSLLKMRLDSALSQPDLSDDDLDAAVTEFFAVFRGTTIPMFGTPNIYLKVADTYLKRKARSALVPEWVQASAVEEDRRRKTVLARMPDNQNLRKDVRRAEFSDRIYGLSILTEYYLGAKLTSDAKRTVAEMEMVLSSFKLAPDDDKRTQEAYAKNQAHFHFWRAEIAHSERKNDAALAEFHAAFKVLAQAGIPNGLDGLRERAKAVWSETKGPDGSFELWLTEANQVPALKPAVMAETTRPDAKKAQLNFALKDMNGRMWRSSDLLGKKVLINFWATWCGPCMQELPYVQKLHEQLRSDSSVQVVTVNVDENAGLIAPFLAKHRYLFVVLPTFSTSKTPFGDLSGIPRTWFVGINGEVAHVEAGFSGAGEEFQARALRFLKGKL